MHQAGDEKNANPSVGVLVFTAGSFPHERRSAERVPRCNDAKVFTKFEHKAPL